MRTVWSSWIIAFAVTACAPSKVDLDFDGNNGPRRDSDGGGVTDQEEEELGTDPDSEDSDGDGWADGVEVDGFTDPTDPNDHPYTGGWPIDECRHDIVSTGGTGVGAIVDNYTLTDQYGEEIRLHDFCDHVVLLEAVGFP